MSQLIYNSLKKHGIKHSFLYSGGAIMPLIDKFHNSEIKYYVPNHEQFLGHMATGYSKSLGRLVPGISIVTSGPGITNMVTPMLDATLDSTPLIVISGQVPESTIGTQAFQEAPSTKITAPVTKWSYLVKQNDNLEEVMDKAFKIATTGRPGSVHIDLPKCIASKNLELEKNKNENENEILKKNNLGDINKYDQINKIIASSKKPILYVGQGCSDIYSVKRLRRFAISNNIPVTTTIHGHGIFDETHELSLEFLGMHGHPAANIAMQQADCIIAIGSRFDDRTTGNLKYFAKNAKNIIWCNNDSDTIDRVKKLIDIDYIFMDESINFLRRLFDNNNNNTVEWVKHLSELKKKYKFAYNDPGYNKINTQMVAEELNNHLTDQIISTGVGNHQMMSSQFIKWRHPNTFLSSGSLGVMGVGLPYGIGAQIARPDKQVIVFDGDGSFNMSLTELGTVAKYNIPIKIMIMDDSNLSMVKTWEELFFDGRITATNITNPNYVKLARSFGIHAFECISHDSLKDSITEMMQYHGPVLCRFKVESDQCMPLVKPGHALDDMLLLNDTYIKDDNNMAPS
jgi:acetolactate synthase-1/2/3 large subunit